MNRPRQDSHLLKNIPDLDNEGTGGGNVTDDDRLLRYAPPGSILRLAIPRSLIPGILVSPCYCGHSQQISFVYPLPNETAESVAKKFFKLLLTFGIPLSLRSDPGKEFTAEVVQHLSKWLNMTIDYGPTDHSRAQEAVERLGGWIHETLAEL